MAGAFVTILGVICALLAGLYQLYLGPLLNVLGVFHTVQNVGLEKADCEKRSEFQACEKLVLFQPTGVLYLACSSLESRVSWIPATGQLNASGKSNKDYVATYDPSTRKITRLTFDNFDSDQGVSVHGMDVVQSASNPSDLFVYMVNHRAPAAGLDASIVGADSVIEVFKTKVKGTKLTHIKTVQDPAILTPNDVVGEADGGGFYFTNDHGTKTAFARSLRAAFSTTTSVGYCRLDRGCKIAASGLISSNGIAKASNDTIYVASNLGAKVTVFERQADDSLTVMDVIPTGEPLDNLSLDNNGVLWAAAFPKGLDMSKHMLQPEHLSPASALKIFINTGPNSFYGEKYKVEKVVENDGTIASGSTSVVHDSERGLLFMHGIAASHLTVCKI